jgi:hypothetical protein
MQHLLKEKSDQCAAPGSCLNGEVITPQKLSRERIEVLLR